MNVDELLAGARDGDERAREIVRSGNVVSVCRLADLDGTTRSLPVAIETGPPPTTAQNGSAEWSADVNQELWLLRGRVSTARLTSFRSRAANLTAAQTSFEGSTSMSLLWILVIALIILAVAGGAAVSSFLWLVLIVALVVAVFAFLSGRRAV